MKFDVIPGRELSSELRARWSAIQDLVPELDNPYFHPDFTAAVARVRTDVEIGILEDAGRVVGFFPFQRTSRTLAKPVGGRLSDFQAVIAEPGTEFAPDELLRGCGLKAWDFDHLIGQPPVFEPYTHFKDGSPFIDLSQGFGVYEAERGQLGKEELQQTSRKARKLAREVGPLRLEASCVDDGRLDELIRWKAAQYQRTEVTNVFGFRWTSELLHDLLATGTSEFQGMLNVLYAGDRVVAMHFGLFSRGVLHYWFPSYDVSFGRYSPGRILLLELCRFCRELGIRRVDLGRGMAGYKTRAMTGVTEVAIGGVDLRPVTAVMRAGWRHTQDWIRQSPWRKHVRLPGRALYRLREWLEFR